jgi:hypothetical protein
MVIWSWHFDFLDVIAWVDMAPFLVLIRIGRGWD